MKTVLITGCSSGFGLETARHFLERGWQVVATMRSPNNQVLPPVEGLRVLPLDVTDVHSIGACVAAAGSVDVLVNNAGIGLLGALEGIPLARIREIFETNTFGTMAMTQALLPQFRQRRSGVVVNVTSSVTLKSLPLLAVYTGSKAAVNAFTECLALELAPFNIAARLVLPGRSPATRFGENARPRMEGSIPEPYAELAGTVFAEWAQQPAEAVTSAADVAEAIWRAATDPVCPMRLAAGVDAVALMA